MVRAPRPKIIETAPQPENWRELVALGEQLRAFATTEDPSALQWRPTDEELAKSPIPVTAEDYGPNPWRILGEKLIQIAQGVDARAVFGQKKAGRGTPRKDVFRRARSWAYWQSRLEGKKRPEAIRIAAALFPYLPPPSDATVLREARAYRDEFFARHRAAGTDTTKLEAQLAENSRRGRF